MSADFIQMISNLNERRLLRTMQSLTASKTSCGLILFIATGMTNAPIPSKVVQLII